MASPTLGHSRGSELELSMGWVDPWVEMFSFLVGWVGSETFLKILKLSVSLYVMFVICIKVIPDKLGLWVGLVWGSKVFTLRWVGLGEVGPVVLWVGLG